MEKKITDIIKRSIDTRQTIGANCIVCHKGKKIVSLCMGFADLERNKMMQSDTIFRLFSLTKPVTSAAAMILIDNGIISPDDPVSKFFPEYNKLSFVGENEEILPCGTELKISHLLNMTSGLPYANNYCTSVRASAKLFDELIEAQGTDHELTTLDFCRKAAKIPLMFSPGEKWDYGISADIMGGVIEVASGMKYSSFLQKNIFEPLGMTDTGFFVPSDKMHRFSALYSWQEKGLARDCGNYLGLTDYSAPPSFESAGAGLLSTIEDYSKFAMMLANKGALNNVRLFSEDTFRYMTSPALSKSQLETMWERLDGYNYGNFMRILEHEEKSQLKTVKGEFGWDGWTGTFFAADPENDLTVLYFTQICGAGTTDEARMICCAVYDSLVRNC